jgi:hypothetical protein
VVGMNEQDGTFNLDVRQHAAPNNMSPIDKPTCNEDIWPAGTWVTYESGTHGLLPGLVQSHNPADGTYNLDVREHAPVDRMRARIGDGSPTASSGGDGTPYGHQQTANAQMGGDGMRTEKQFEATYAPPGGDGACYQQQPPNMMRVPTPTDNGAPSSMQARPADGSKCFVVEHGSGYPEVLPAIIEGFNQSDGSYSLLVEPQKVRRRQQVRPEMIRATNTPADAWPPGTQVFYESASLGTWLPAVIVSFNGANSTYNLDVRENANPQQIRTR